MQTKWPMTLSLMLRKWPPKKAGLWSLPLFLTNIRKKNQRPAYFGGNIQPKRSLITWLGRTVFETVPVTFTPFCLRKKNVFFVTDEPPSQRLFCLCKPNDQWPCLLCWENGRQEGRPLVYPLFLTNIKEGTKGRPSLAAHFLNIENKVASPKVLTRIVEKEEASVTKKYILPATRRKNVFLSQMNLLLKDFSAYANQMTNDLVSYVELMAAKKAAFCLPLFLTNIKRKPRPAFFGGHFLNKIIKIGNGLHRRKSLWEGGPSVTKILDTEKECIFCHRWILLLKALFCLCKPNDQWPCLLCWKWPPKKAGLGSTSLPHKYQEENQKAGLLWRPFSQGIRTRCWSFEVCIGRKVFEKEGEFIFRQKYILPDNRERMYFCHRWNSFSETFLPIQTKWPMTLSLMLRKWPPTKKAGLWLPLFLTNIKEEENQRPALLWRPFSQAKSRWSIGFA